jgi:hypothetical protein
MRKFLMEVKINKAAVYNQIKRVRSKLQTLGRIHGMLMQDINDEVRAVEVKLDRLPNRASKPAPLRKPKKAGDSPVRERG